MRSTLRVATSDECLSMSRPELSRVLQLQMYCQVARSPAVCLCVQQRADCYGEHVQQGSCVSSPRAANPAGVIKPCSMRHRTCSRLRLEAVPFVRRGVNCCKYDLSSPRNRLL